MVNEITCAPKRAISTVEPDGCAILTVYKSNLASSSDASRVEDTNATALSRNERIMSSVKKEEVVGGEVELALRVKEMNSEMTSEERWSRRRGFAVATFTAKLTAVKCTT